MGRAGLLAALLLAAASGLWAETAIDVCRPQPRFEADFRAALEAVLQEPCDTKHDLPFVITVEPSPEQAVLEAVQKMSELDFLLEPPLALPMEEGL